MAESPQNVQQRMGDVNLRLFSSRSLAKATQAPYRPANTSSTHYQVAQNKHGIFCDLVCGFCGIR